MKLAKESTSDLHLEHSLSSTNSTMFCSMHTTINLVCCIGRSLEKIIELPRLKKHMTKYVINATKSVSSVDTFSPESSSAQDDEYINASKSTLINGKQLTNRPLTPGAIKIHVTIPVAQGRCSRPNSATKPVLASTHIANLSDFFSLNSKYDLSLSVLRISFKVSSNVDPMQQLG